MSGPSRSRRPARGPSQDQASASSSSQGSAGLGNAARAEQIRGEVTLVRRESPELLNVKIRSLEGGTAQDVGEGASFQAGGLSNFWGTTTKVGNGWVRGEIQTHDLSAEDRLQADGTVIFRDLPQVDPSQQAAQPAPESVPLTGDFIQEMNALDEKKKAELEASMKAEQDAHLEGADGGMAAQEEERHRELMKDMKAAQDEEYEGRGP